MIIDLEYIAICSQDTSPGIYKKANGFVNGAKKIGLKSIVTVIEPMGLKGYKQYIKSVYNSKANTIVVRYIPKLGLALLVLGFILRLTKRSLIIDVPTPMTNHINEIKNSKTKLVSKIFNIFMILIQGSIPFISSTKVIQYADESLWFSLFVKNKILLTGNAVDVDSIPLKKSFNSKINRLNLIAVGTVAIWHGWDKILQVMKELKEEQFNKFDIYLTIVGDGEELDNLKRLTSLYHLNKYVIFTGFLKGDKLYKAYNDAHIGLGSFGWNRIDVKVASPIKSREYLAAGLPIIYATKDIDFNENSIFSYMFKDENTIEELKEYIENLDISNLPIPKECRGYALENLDFSIKVKKVLEK